MDKKLRTKFPKP